MAQISRQFQDPSYVTRQDANLGALAAGSGGQTSKFVAFAALQLFSLTTYLSTVGTSTYTANGTQTTLGQQVSVIVIQNTNTTGTAVTLSTATYGPFLAGGQGLSTAAVGGVNQFLLNTTAGTAGQGGVPIPFGAQVYCVSGTDATAVSICTVDYQIQPGAGLQA
jgi:hypothetical protein